MRAALLLSVLALVCGVAALFGYPTVSLNSTPAVGLPALLMSMALAAVFPATVLAWRKFFSSKSSGLGHSE